MSRIDELIRELCSKGVELRPLRAVGSWQGGGTPSKHNPDYWRGGTIPWVTSKDMGDFELAGTEDHITHAAVSGSAAKIIPENSVAIVMRSGVLKHTLPVSLVPFQATVNQDLRAVTCHDDVMSRYALHVLRANAELVLASCRKVGGTVESIDAKRLMAFRIPIPPLEVQREIVRILDLFTTLEVELEAELEARRRQYAHYRDSLLTFPEGEVRWVPMGRVATVVRGGSPRPIHDFVVDTPDGIPWIKIGDVAENGKYVTETAERVSPAGAAKSRRVRPGDFLLSNSMSFGRPYISRIEGCIHDGWLAVSDFDSSFIPDFLYHLLRSAAVQVEFSRRAGAGTVRNLNADIVKSVVLPVPALEEQARIVAILDKFDALVNDLSVGLPAELAARRAQYEHYRDRLLTFEEAVA